MSNPYVSKRALERALQQSEARLGAAVALLRKALHDCPENTVQVENFTQLTPPSDLEISYDKATDTLSCKVKA